MEKILTRLVRGYASLPPKQAKYRNCITTRGALKFASKAEANRYDQLCLLEKNGEIRNLKLQVSYPLQINGVLICRYRADFVYEERVKGTELTIGGRVAWNWREVVEDRKGFATPAYKIKKKLMFACHGIIVRET